MVRPGQKEEAVRYVMKKYALKSHARACRLVRLSRTRRYYVSKMEAKEKPVLEAIEEVLKSRRYGRKKVIGKLAHQKPELSPFKIRRVYVKYGFSLPVKPSKRVRCVKSNPLVIPMSPNKSWHVDFMSDVLVDGRKIRTFNGIDAFNRSCLGIEIDFSMPSVKVTQILDRWIEKYGKPEAIRSDNGPEFISKHFKKWLRNKAIQWEEIRPGHPEENGLIERFNGTYRREILDTNVFYHLDHCRHITQEWMTEYNQDRPHESLNFKTPMAYGT